MSLLNEVSAVLLEMSSASAKNEIFELADIMDAADTSREAAEANDDTSRAHVWELVSQLSRDYLNSTDPGHSAICPTAGEHSGGGHKDDLPAIEMAAILALLSRNYQTATTASGEPIALRDRDLEEVSKDTVERIARQLRQDYLEPLPTDQTCPAGYVSTLDWATPASAIFVAALTADKA